MENRKKIAFEILINNIITTFLLITSMILKANNLLIFGVDGNEESFIFILPLFAFLATFFFAIVGLIERNSAYRKSNRFAYHRINMDVVLMLNLMQTFFILSLAIPQINITLQTIMLLVIGLFISIFGNNMPRIKEGSWIKALAWQFKNKDEQWHKFMRVSGFIWVISGLSIMAFSIIPGYLALILTVSLILGCGTGMLIFSFVLIHRKK